MLKTTLICLLALFGVCVTYCYIKLHEENERSKRQARIERRRSRMYAEHSEELYGRYLSERRTADMRGAVITAYKERCGE